MSKNGSPRGNVSNGEGISLILNYGTNYCLQTVFQECGHQPQELVIKENYFITCENLY